MATKKPAAKKMKTPMKSVLKAKKKVKTASKRIPDNKKNPIDDYTDIV